MAEPQFGGPWTEEKLSRLRKYLRAYMTIFSTHPQAKLLKTVYVDAFAVQVPEKTLLLKPRRPIFCSMLLQTRMLKH